MFNRIKAKVKTKLRNAAGYHEIMSSIRQQNEALGSVIENQKQLLSVVAPPPLNPSIPPYRIDRDFFSEYSEDRAKRLFRDNVQTIIFETSSFCNRICWFCPDKYIDRRSEMKYMDDALFRKILHELAEVGFQGDISFAGYNEPLADKNFPAKVKLAREILPAAPMHINTNGDYLTPEKLHELYTAGLARLLVSVYTDAETPGTFTYDDGMDAVLKMNKKLGLNAKIVTEPNDVHCMAVTRYGKTDAHRGLYIQLHAENHNLTTRYRGGSLADTVPVPRICSREKMCITPFTNFIIYYTGLVMPCVEFRPDFPGHVPYISGDCKCNTIYEIFCGEAGTRFRKGLIFDINLSPCKHCIEQSPHYFFVEFGQ